MADTPRVVLLIALLAAALLMTNPAAANRPQGYMVIPITGPIGFQGEDDSKETDVLAAGIERALDVAKKRGVTKIVFRFDTPGGNVAEGLAIAELMNKYTDDFDYIAEVEKNCISAGVLLLAACGRPCRDRRSDGLRQGSCYR